MIAYKLSLRMNQLPAAILRSKEAADRPQDRQDAVILREMLRADGESVAV